MKLILRIGCILILLSNFWMNCFSQSFIDKTKIWTVSSLIVDGHIPAITEYYRFGEDTVMNGLSYTLMYFSQDIENLGHAEGDAWIEKEPGKIYIKATTWEHEDLLYDFTLQVGDTSSHKEASDRIIMDSIVVKAFGIEQRKYYYSHFIIAPNKIVTWVEGVGSLFAPNMSDDFGYAGSITRLICFEEQGEHIYLNPLYTDCDASTGTDVTNNLQPENLIEFFCEPGGSIRIRNISNSKGTLSLFDFKGGQVLKAHITSKESRICPPSFGILVYRYETNNGKVQTGKVEVK